MVDIDKQITYWQEGPREDWAVARELVDRGRVRHDLFFAHLALEKALKALVCRRTRDLAPRIHNLSRLAVLAAIDPSPEQTDVLAEMNVFSLEGRYPGSPPPPTPAEGEAYAARAEGVFRWLMSPL